MKIAFLGTPEFAVPSLKMLIEEGHEIEVFTQPDRPKDRGHGFAMPPVKQIALENGLPVHQFARIKSPEGVEAMRGFAPDLMVTAAFGQLLSQENLDVPRLGCINVHGSLLPKYRGAAPIQWAIINGETVTGVTTMMTNIGMDTGDILLTRETAIGEDETYGELYGRLAVLGADLLNETIARLIGGSLERIPQNEEYATRCGMIKREHTFVDFSASAESIRNLIRGLNPAPAAYTTLDGQRIKLYRAVSHEDMPEYSHAGIGECVIASAKKGLYVKTANGLLEITELQFENSKRMSAKVALNGKKLEGRILGH